MDNRKYNSGQQEAGAGAQENGEQQEKNPDKERRNRKMKQRKAQGADWLFDIYKRTPSVCRNRRGIVCHKK